jgi:hypothetical protein
MGSPSPGMMPGMGSQAPPPGMILGMVPGPGGQSIGPGQPPRMMMPPGMVMGSGPGGRNMAPNVATSMQGMMAGHDPPGFGPNGPNGPGGPVMAPPGIDMLRPPPGITDGPGTSDGSNTGTKETEGAGIAVDKLLGADTSGFDGTRLDGSAGANDQSDDIGNMPVSPLRNDSRGNGAAPSSPQIPQGTAISIGDLMNLAQTSTPPPADDPPADQGKSAASSTADISSGLQEKWGDMDLKVGEDDANLKAALEGTIITISKQQSLEMLQNT